MSTTKQVTIFIAEDHLIARMGLKMLLSQTSHFSVIGEAEDGESAVEKILEAKPEIVMMDLDLPKVDGIQATALIKKALPDTKVLIFTSAEDDASIFSALKAGADGYCLKTISGEFLAIAIQSVLTGAAWLDPGIAQRVLRAQVAKQDDSANSAKSLSDSKLQLLSLVEKGKSMDEIALELKVNDSLVKGLLNELLTQLKGDKPAPAMDKTQASLEPGNISIKPGDVIGQHYKIEERIGHGGMGAVFRAKHTFIDRTVAIKTLHEHLASEPSTLERFKIEAESNAAVTHQNLVSIYDFGLVNGVVPYIAMEYLDGKNLDDMLEQDGIIDEPIAKNIFAQVCDALQAVHSKGIVHRDLKPGNVMLVNRDNNPHFVKVVDFGIAKILDGSNKNVTKTGECLGSPLYMSPEQCMGSGKASLDHRSDLYALGCMMFEAFSGTIMFNGESFLDVVMKHLRETPSTAPLERQKISPRIIDLIVKLTKKNPNDWPARQAKCAK